VALGLGFAVATSVASVLGFLFKHRGAVRAPAVRWSSLVRSSVELFRSPWYALGLAVAMASWGLHVTALSLAPISIVQSIIAGGLVLVTILADRLFGMAVSRREWVGVALMAAGLAFLAATLRGTADSAHNTWDAATLTLYAGGATVIGTALVAHSRGRRDEGLWLAASAGALWGASDISIKALSGRLGDLGAGVMLQPLALVILALSLYGLLVSGRSLQLGDAVPVIAVTSAVANVLTIASGPVVFGEPMPGDALGVAVRVAAFVLVVAATALTPPPVRAAEPGPAQPAAS
jgi:multidrug transporter EmrE-like cation transporter